jgi:hypothetical protein
MKLHTDRYCPGEKEGIILPFLKSFKDKAGNGYYNNDDLVLINYSARIATYNIIRLKR